MVVKKGTLSVSLYEGAPSTIYTVWEFIEDVENLIVMRNEAFPSNDITALQTIIASLEQRITKLENPSDTST